MTEAKRLLRVFLCHASADKPAVRQLYDRLMNDGVDAWLDEEKLIPGQNWKVEIPRAVRDSDVVIVCLSSFSITKEGFVQKEIKVALDEADEKPEETIFIIPARLENCDVPERISNFQWVDLFSDNGYERLLQALQIRANNLGVTIRRKKSPSTKTMSPKSPKNALLEKGKDPNEEKVAGTSPIQNAAPSELSPENQVKEVEAFDDQLTQEPPIYPEGVHSPEQKGFSVWYADSKKFNSTSKIYAFTDKGNLKAKNGTLMFEGEKLNLDFSQVVKVSQVRPKIPWGAYLVVTIVNIIALLGSLIFSPSKGWTSVFFIFLPMILISNIASIGINYIMKWVRIDYLDSQGVNCSAFFFDQSYMRWGGILGGILGGSSKLYQELNATLSST